MPILYSPKKKQIAQLIETLMASGTVLSLKAVGANGQNNNVFVDSSQSNHTVSRFGNTTQGSFTPFSQPDGKWSVQLNGSTDRITFPQQSLTGDFTIECWFKQTSKSLNYVPLVCSDSGVYNFPLILDYQGQGYVGFYLPGGPGISTGVKVFDLGVWTHVATVRKNSVVSMYVNGTRVVESTRGVTTVVDFIGGYASSGYFLNGSISNVRITNGVALYEGASFSPLSAPMTASAQTSILACSSNRFIDRSLNASSLSVLGVPQISLDSPFPTAEYVPATNSGSAKFDGSGDCLTFPAQAAVGSGDFTVDFWIYPESFGSGYRVLFANATAGGFSSTITSAGRIQFGRSLQATEGTSTNSVNFNSWNHVALSRTSGTLRIFINGTQGYSATITTNYSSGVTVLGVDGNYTSFPYTGFISQFRVHKTESIYTADFVPPTVPVEASTAATSVLLNFTNAAIVDSTGRHVFETVGGARANTSVVRAGKTGSLHLDGVLGSYVSIPHSQDFEFGSSDMTIEMWFQTQQNTAAGQYPWLIGKRWDGVPYTGAWSIFTSNGTVNSPISVWMADFSSSVPFMVSSVNTHRDGNWHHLAWTRMGNVHKLFLDGIQVASNTSTVSFAASVKPIILGTDLTFSTSSRMFLGYVSDLEVTKGVAKYTSNFTPV